MIAIPAEEEPIPNVVSSSHQKTQSPRQALNLVTELPQTSEAIPNVLDEAVYEEWDDRVERAITTTASLDAEQSSGNINRTQSMAIPNVPLPQGIGAGGSPRIDGFMYNIVQESGELGGRLDANKEGVTLVTPTLSQEDQPEDQLGVFSAVKVLADATKENVHTYTRKRRAVSLGSGGISTTSRLFSTAEESVSTAGASMPVSTTGMVQEVNISIPLPVVVKIKEKKKDKGWLEFMKQLNLLLRKNEKTLKQELKLMKRYLGDYKQRKGTTEAKRNKPMTQSQQRNYMINYIKHMGSHILQQLKRYSFDELKELFETTIKNVNTFKPMETEDREGTSELAAGSSQAIIIDFAEVGRSVQEQPDKELSQEDLQKMMMVVLVEEVYVKALQVKYPIIDLERCYLKNPENLEDHSGLNLVKERFSSTEPNYDKERALWVELKRPGIELGFSETLVVYLVPSDPAVTNECRPAAASLFCLDVKPFEITVALITVETTF
ncbi:hypothetical protein Tco_1316274 [Tanacetum coccineum]